MLKLVNFLLPLLKEDHVPVLRDMLHKAISNDFAAMVSILLSRMSLAQLDELNCTELFLKESLEYSRYDQECTEGLEACVANPEVRCRLDLQPILLNQSNPSGLGVLVEYSNEHP
ncbi:hypothetical protein HDU96_001882, partial [Phlyctochytrium bullatum]